MIDAELKEKWLQALRGGEYQQGRGALKQPSPMDPRELEYCCLGVLCDITEEGQWRDAFASHDDVYPFDFGEVSSCYIPPMLFLNTIGFDFTETELVDELADMNDDGMTFDEIANWIEENL